MRIASLLLSLFAIGCFPPLPPDTTASTDTDPPSTTDPTTTTIPSAEVEIGECYGDYSTTDSDSGGPVVWAEVDADGRIVVQFEDRSVNCCPEPRGVFSGTGPDLVLDFDPSTSATECDCFCVSDITVTSDPYPAGDYLLEVFYEGVSEGTLEVVVP